MEMKTTHYYSLAYGDLVFFPFRQLQYRMSTQAGSNVSKKETILFVIDCKMRMEGTSITLKHHGESCDQTGI